MKTSHQTGSIAIVLMVLAVIITFGYVIAKDLLHYDFSRFIPTNLTNKITIKNPDQLSVTQLPTLISEVSITAKGFFPATIKIKKNTQLTWKNLDFKPHQVASDPHPAHTLLPVLGDGVELETNDTFSITYEEVGKFTYHDHLNPTKFTGTVIVE